MPDTTTDSSLNQPSIAIIGAGWYGIHIALALHQKMLNTAITLYERNTEIMNSISGNFGIRLHAGPHYPRSKETRESCHKGFREFLEHYPELVNEHLYSIYGLGETDSDNQPPKVSQAEFLSVAQEFGEAEVITPKDWGYKNLMTAVTIHEPCIVLGEKLRYFLKKRLDATKIKLLLGVDVIEAQSDHQGKMRLVEKKGEILRANTFDYIINTTAYSSLLPAHPELPLGINVKYQVCVALEYEDRERPLHYKPDAFIVMDGWFPCRMYYDDGSNGYYLSSKTGERQYYPSSKHILTHGKHTIIGSFSSYPEGQACFESLSDDFINQKVKPACESEMQRFWPHFTERFAYQGWKGSVLAKLETDKEFRASFVFQDKQSQLIYVFPGKVSNIFDAEKEVLALIEGASNRLVNKGTYRYLRQGVLDSASQEVTEKPKNSERNTCHLSFSRFSGPVFSSHSYKSSRANTASELKFHHETFPSKPVQEDVQVKRMPRLRKRAHSSETFFTSPQGKKLRVGEQSKVSDCLEHPLAPSNELLFSQSHCGFFDGSATRKNDVSNKKGGKEMVTQSDRRLSATPH